MSQGISLSQIIPALPVVFFFNPKCKIKTLPDKEINN
jgi:hypothetical protein